MKLIKLYFYVLNTLLFRVAIQETRHHINDSDLQIVGLDGTTYFFIMNDPSCTGGRIWSPQKNTNMGNLIGIASGLVGFAKEEKTVVYDDALLERIEKLKKDLVQKK